MGKKIDDKSEINYKNILINDMNILGAFIKNSYIWHIMLAVVFGLVSVVFISYRNLDMHACAIVMEVYAIFTGVFLFAPLLFPEQDADFFSLEKTKAYSITRLITLRIILASILTFIAILGYVIAFKHGNSKFEVNKLVTCSFVEFFYLGSMAFAVSAMTKQIVFGYMISVMYYLFCFGSGKKYLGALALFKMQRGNYEEWGLMLLVSIVLLFFPLIWKIIIAFIVGQLNKFNSKSYSNIADVKNNFTKDSHEP